MIALDHHPAVVGKPREDGQRRVGVELVGRIEFRHALAAVREPLDDHVRVDAKGVADGDFLGRFRIDVNRAVSHVAGPSIGSLFASRRATYRR